MNVNIVTQPEMQIAVLEHKGPMETVMASAGQFRQWRIETGYSPIASCKTFGIILCDPKNTAPEDFRFDIAGEVPQPVPENAFGIINKTLAAGRCAPSRPPRRTGCQSLLPVRAMATGKRRRTPRQPLLLPLSQLLPGSG